MRIRLLILLTIFAPVLLLLSCKPKIRTGPTEKDFSGVEVLRKNRAAKVRFRTLSIQGKADYVSPKESYGLTYHINIAEDSLIWFNVTKLTYPLLTALVDEDSIQLKVKAQTPKKLVKCDFGMISNVAGMDVDFKTLQNLLVGNTNWLADTLLEEKTGDPQYKFTGKNAVAAFAYFFDASNFKLARLEADDKRRATQTSITYGNFLPVGDKIFPQKVLMEVKNPETTTITLEHSKIEIDGENVSFRFKIPSSYDVEYCSEPNEN